MTAHGKTPLVHARLTQSEEDIAEILGQIGERVRKARQQKAVSQRALSEISGVSQRYIAQLESGSGNISVALLYKIASALGSTPMRLLGGTLDQDIDELEFAALYRSADAERRSKARNMLATGVAPEEKKNRICLVGLRGAGKSSLGKLAADKCSMKFMELNTVIEEQSGMAVSEVMALYGQEGYRQLEQQALESIIQTEEAVVLAVGGGIVSERETWQRVLGRFHTVWLKASPDEHMQRVREQGDSRPMAGNPRAMEELKSILTSREALYALAGVHLDTSGKPLQTSASELAACIARLPGN